MAWPHLASHVSRLQARFARYAYLVAAMPALLLIRIWLAFTLRVNSDEPQHLHTAWCWTQGILPYRDVFDNHAPLFYILYAPLLAMLGERADIVPLMRLAVIPWYGLTLWFTYLLASRLYDRRIGWIAVALTAVQPVFFNCSVEFRPDDAWAAAWLGALVIAVSGRPTPKRALQCGLVVGLAFAFSIKSIVLIVAAFAAAVLVLLVLALQRRMPRSISILRITIATAIGTAILPSVIVAAFAGAGALDAIRYCLFVHNDVRGLGRWSRAAEYAWIFPLLLPPLAVLVQRMLRDATDPLLPALRAWLLATALMYLALRASYQPLLDRQDLLPLVPMLTPAVAALLMRMSRWYKTLVRGSVIVAVVLLFETGITLASSRPWRDDANRYTDELHTLLRLSHSTDYVMDDKDESIYRMRPLYWILENVTRYRLARGLMHDDIIQRLVVDRVGVGVFDRESGKDLDFVRNNYVTIAPDVEVAGKILGEGTAGAPIDFDLSLPNRYALEGRSGIAEGSLDGTPYNAPRDLSAGPHVFIPARSDDWAIVWARAARMGYSPFASSGGAGATRRGNLRS
jgi:hypothetical protein